MRSVMRCFEAAQVQGRAVASGVGDPAAEPEQVVRAAGLGAGPDGRALPAAERLALHDRAGDAAG